MVTVTKDDVNVTVKKGTDKVAAFADVSIAGFGAIIGCPVWLKEGNYRAGLPQRQGKDKNFDVLKLDTSVEHIVLTAIIDAVRANAK